MDFEYQKKIREITIKAIFSDDVLMEHLVLKGGNALDVIYNISSRASMDLDFSIENDFDEKSLEDIKSRLSKTLTTNFGEHGYSVFDISFYNKPRNPKATTPRFWGGYKLEFKIIEKSKKLKLGEDIDQLRKNAEVVGFREKRIFNIEISKYEYCKDKSAKDLDGYTIYVYPPAIIAIEKLRAICQQMEEYAAIIGSDTRSPRAKDFFDIYIISHSFKIDWKSSNIAEQIRAIFEAKNVPLLLLKNVENYREYHKDDFLSVKDSVRPEKKIRDYDFYFNFVIRLIEDLKAAGVV